jgi:hypothetical protein
VAIRSAETCIIRRVPGDIASNRRSGCRVWNLRFGLGRKHRMRPWICAISTPLIILVFPYRASATLGMPAASVQSDQAAMQGALRMMHAVGYTVQELQAPTGTVVREYVSITGTVFGVGWEGPFLPDLRQLLGPYFERYSKLAKAQKARRVVRGPLLIQESDLVVEMTGNSRTFLGRAYVREMLPQGIDAGVIQ